jgi:hypothetical protein
MRSFLSNYKVQLGWRYFLAWFWPASFWVLLTDSAIEGAFLGAIFFFLRDWRNSPYDDSVAGGAGNRERWRTAIFFLLLLVGIYLLAHFVFPHRSFPSLLSAVWLVVAIATTIIVHFTKPLPKPEGKASKVAPSR